MNLFSAIFRIDETGLGKSEVKALVRDAFVRARTPHTLQIGEVAPGADGTMVVEIGTDADGGWVDDLLRRQTMDAGRPPLERLEAGWIVSGGNNVAAGSYRVDAFEGAPVQEVAEREYAATTRAKIGLVSGIAIGVLYVVAFAAYFYFGLTTMWIDQAWKVREPLIFGIWAVFVFIVNFAFIFLPHRLTQISSVTCRTDGIAIRRVLRKPVWLRWEQVEELENSAGAVKMKWKGGAVVLFSGQGAVQDQETLIRTIVTRAGLVCTERTFFLARYRQAGGSNPAGTFSR